MTNGAGNEPTEIVPPGHKDDPRSDIEQAVEARSDALERGEGGAGRGPEGAMMTDPGEFSGNLGTGGEVRNQDMDAQ
ncbi:hypothetical protein [Sphingomonas sp.]|jgi:hypothetical protein|uniref:hypothetical protein n=1 Tax=Sphingomonas sp. TaxID=28214 RepID=UPI002D800E60|nr:hypothetical protein [Sphingomonas sp.]HEU0043640.1 hypothetical protein [Sphingomonas sp.]